MSWLFDPNELVSPSVREPDIEIMNVEDRGEYFERPEDAVGIIVQSTLYPAAVACWYANNHDGEWNVYGDQAVGTQQTYFLGGTTKIFVGTF